MTREQNIAITRWQLGQYVQWIKKVDPEWKWLQELGRMNWQAALDDLEGRASLPGDYYTKERMDERAAIAKAKYPPPPTSTHR